MVLSCFWTNTKPIRASIFETVFFVSRASDVHNHVAVKKFRALRFILISLHIFFAISPALFTSLSGESLCLLHGFF